MKVEVKETPGEGTRTWTWDEQEFANFVHKYLVEEHNLHLSENIKVHIDPYNFIMSATETYSL